MTSVSRSIYVLAINQNFLFLRKSIRGGVFEAAPFGARNLCVDIGERPLIKDLASEFKPVVRSGSRELLSKEFGWTAIGS
jgi:hypothetical protein